LYGRRIQKLGLTIGFMSAVDAAVELSGRKADHPIGFLASPLTPFFGRF